MRNNVFKNNAIYDVLVDGTAANWVIENNFFGWPVQPLGNGSGRRDAEGLAGIRFQGRSRP